MLIYDGSLHSIDSSYHRPIQSLAPMVVTLQLRQLDVPSGQRLLIRNLQWPEFENILTELGDRRAARIAYD